MGNYAIFQKFMGESSPKTEAVLAVESKRGQSPYYILLITEKLLRHRATSNRCKQFINIDRTARARMVHDIIKSVRTYPIRQEHIISGLHSSLYISQLQVNVHVHLKRVAPLMVQTHSSTVVPKEVTHQSLHSKEITRAHSMRTPPKSLALDKG